MCSPRKRQHALLGIKLRPPLLRHAVLLNPADEVRAIPPGRRRTEGFSAHRVDLRQLLPRPARRVTSGPHGLDTFYSQRPLLLVHAADLHDCVAALAQPAQPRRLAARLARRDTTLTEITQGGPPMQAKIASYLPHHGSARGGHRYARPGDTE